MAHRRIGRRRSIIVIFALVAAGLGIPAGAGAAPGATGASASDEHAKRGEVYRGLRRGAANGPCAGIYETADARGKTRCSHGPDPAPKGVDVRRHRPTSELAASTPTSGTAAAAAMLPCYGDGASGKRVQVLYARSSDKPDRFAQIAPLIPQWAAKTDAVFVNSAAVTGGVRHIRFVTGASCTLSITNVVLSSSGDDSITNTIDELDAKGYNRTDRTYLIYTDANVYCGIGSIMDDDRPTSSNLNNVGPSYARVDSGCWAQSVPVEAHEVMHNLGGVQNSAPNASGGFHCTDEYDRMCYPDAPGVTTTIACPTLTEALFDCGNDDYFTTAAAPTGYLATHWNAANNAFLSAAAPDAWGSTSAPPAPTPTPTPAPTLVTSRYTGSFGSAWGYRLYTVGSGAGPLSATLVSNGSSAYAVKVMNAAGKVIALSYGVGLVQLTMPVAKSTYTVVVIGHASAFALWVTRPKA